MTSTPGRVEEATRWWMDALQGEYAASTIEIVLEARERYNMYLVGPYFSALRPNVIEVATRDEIRAAALTVHHAIVAAAERLRRDPALRRAAGLPPYLDAMLELDSETGRIPISTRLDGLIDASGTIRFIELNTSPGGAYQQFEATDALCSTPLARAFAERFPFTTENPRDLSLVALVDEARERGRPMPMGLLSVSSTFKAFGVHLAAYAASRGHNVVYGDPSILTVRDDGAYAGDVRIDTVVIGVDDLFLRRAELAPLIDAIRRGFVTLLGGVSKAILCANKLMFGVLSDPKYSDLFDHDTQRALRRHVPWTRHVAEMRTTYNDQPIDLLPFITKHRERFVLKPAGGSGAEGVVLGWHCEASEWEATLAQRRRRPYVVQERVELTPEPYPMLVDGSIVVRDMVRDCNVFVWNGKSAESTLVRVGEVLHNLHAGGSTVPEFILR